MLDGVCRFVDDYGDRCDGFLFAKGRERAGFYLQRVVSELEERTSAFCLLAYALAYVSNQQSGCSRLETLVVRYGVRRLLPLREGR